jgi:hypothetical protein
MHSPLGFSCIKSNQRFEICFSELSSASRSLRRKVRQRKSTRKFQQADFAPAMLEHMQKMRRYKDHDRGVHTPRMIDRFSVI